MSDLSDDTTEMIENLEQSMGKSNPIFAANLSQFLVANMNRIEELEAVADRLELELYEAIEQAHMDGQYVGTDGVTFPHIAAQQYRTEYVAKHASGHQNDL